MVEWITYSHSLRVFFFFISILKYHPCAVMFIGLSEIWSFSVNARLIWPSQFTMILEFPLLTPV